MKHLFLAALVSLLPLFVRAVEPRLTGYVNPFIGTMEMGHTFPGPCVPFGFVQLSPDTDTIPYEVNGRYNPEVYRYCAGYQYLDPTIVGFSHTHFSGTGHSDLGDFLVMPVVGTLRLNPGTADKPGSGYRSRYRKETEEASPGYYRVFLDDPGVIAELTTTARAGFHRYTFPQSDSAHIILDLIHGIYPYDGKVTWASVRIVNDTMVTGYRITRGWARSRYIYFAMTFSKPFKSYGLVNDEKPVYRGFWRRFSEDRNFPEAAGKRIRAHFDFSTHAGEQILVKVGLSAVSSEGALQNLSTEIPHRDFDRTRAEAIDDWEEALGRIRIKGDQQQMVIFYTALYHAFMAPMLYTDTDGRYRGVDQAIHTAKGFTNYTTFSLWDTYRAQHPLLTLIFPGRSSDMVNSMLAHFDQSPQKMLPVWSHHGQENWCMIGYHAVPVIADAWVKGIRGFDPGRALKACVTTAGNKWYDGIPEYSALGYAPDDKVGNSASVTLEYAYDDYTIARFAEELLRDPETPDSLKRFAAITLPLFNRRSLHYRNLWDASSGFIRPRKSDGSFKSPFDPLSTHGQGFIEGNAWNYSLYVPHDIPYFISLTGGDQAFINRLDSLFTMHLDDKHFEGTEDVTRHGIIGNYVHGNEPSHHVPYLYNYTSRPDKTRERVRQIVNTLYRNEPDGLCGNDDCGQMSAWYIFSVLGFYPVCPGTTSYALGIPCVSEAVISLPGGKTFTIVADNYSPENTRVKSITLNGNLLKDNFLDHHSLLEGGKLVFGLTSP